MARRELERRGGEALSVGDAPDATTNGGAFDGSVEKETPSVALGIPGNDRREWAIEDSNL